MLIGLDTHTDLPKLEFPGGFDPETIIPTASSAVRISPDLCLDLRPVG